MTYSCWMLWFSPRGSRIPTGPRLVFPTVTVTFFGAFVSVLQFLPPHVPTEEEKKTPALFACRVRQAMAQWAFYCFWEHISPWLAQTPSHITVTANSWRHLIWVWKLHSKWWSIKHGCIYAEIEPTGCPNWLLRALLLKNADAFIDVSVCRALGVPVTDHTYEDCRLMISAGELTLPMEAGLVEFTKISRKLK